MGCRSEAVGLLSSASCASPVARMAMAVLVDSRASAGDGGWDGGPSPVACERREGEQGLLARERLGGGWVGSRDRARTRERREKERTRLGGFHSGRALGRVLTL